MTKNELTEIESLVAETFGHVAPAPEIEEELLDSLSAERSGPRRPLRWLAALPLAAAVLVAFFWQRPGREPPPLLAESDAETAVVVRLARGGLLLVQPDDSKDAWEEVSLNGLAEHLKAAAKAHDDAMVASGKSGYEDLPGGIKGSALRVVLRADDETPWQHAQWWLTICAQERFRHLRIEHEGTLLDATLPVDPGIRMRPNPGVVTEVKVSIHIAARTEKPARWGGVRVIAPTAFRYRFGGGESSDPAVAAKWIGDTLKAVQGQDLTLVGEIKAGHKVPVRLVAGLLARYREHGFERVEFFGTAVPTDSIRNAPRLPYPAANYPGPDPADFEEKEEILEEEIEEEIEEEEIEEPAEPGK